jgi:hypothetical protein
MKKTFVLTLVLLLGVSLAALAGCGGNTKQAQDLTKVADDAYAKVNTQLTTLQNKLTPVLGGAITGNVSGLTQEVLAGATTAFNAVLKEMPAVKADYEKVTALTGVPDYVAYADAMIKAIDASDAAINESLNFINSIIPLVQAGNTAGLTQLLASSSAELTKLQDLSTAASKAYDDAQAIKASKNLK